jgi:phospholipid/cholesterol/gamma-HCH transport system substrate-binding protein
MSRNALELWVGLFVVAGLAAVAMLALQVGNLSTVNVTDAYKVTASFGNVGGLNVKAPVTMAGVKIGRVSSIKIDRDDYSAIVELSIDSRYDNLPTDTSAAVLTSGLLGAQYVGLEPGGEDIYLRQGDRIEITQSAVVLEQLIGQMLFSKAQGDG